MQSHGEAGVLSCVGTSQSTLVSPFLFLVIYRYCPSTVLQNSLLLQFNLDRSGLTEINLVVIWRYRFAPFDLESSEKVISKCCVFGLLLISLDVSD